MKKCAIRAVLLATLAVGFASGATWYVDKDATGSNNGTSWTNAWNSFSNVVWGSSGVTAGDKLCISGGSTSKTYTETWTVGAGGTAGNPITIGLDATNPSHNGVAVFDFDSRSDLGSGTAIYISRPYVTISGNVNGACHLAVRNLRHISDRYAACAIVNNTGNNDQGLIVEYVEVTNCNNGIMLYTTGATVRYCQLNRIRGDRAIGVGGTQAWDNSRVYGNYIETMTNGGGPDGIQASSGISIYNNTFHEITATVTVSTQHPDMLQLTGNYIKVYDNDFINVGDSHFDYDCYANPNPHDIWIYNNLFRIVQAIDTYPEFFRFYNSQNTIASFSNIKILNNTFADQSGYYTVRFDSYNGNPTATGIEIKNNIFYNCGSAAAYPVIRIAPSSGFTANSFDFDGNLYSGRMPECISYLGTTYLAAGWIAAHEPHGTMAAPTFVSYTASDPDNDFRLAASDTAARDRGVALNTYFTEDRDGTARPQGAGWDIGAYEAAATPIHDFRVPAVPEGPGPGFTDCRPLRVTTAASWLAAGGVRLYDMAGRAVTRQAVRPGMYLAKTGQEQDVRKVVVVRY